jgi:hypothetical protein
LKKNTRGRNTTVPHKKAEKSIAADKVVEPVLELIQMPSFGRNFGLSELRGK